MPTGKLQIIPLGGLGDFGMNWMAIGWGDDIIVVDAGLMFPEAELLGVDIVVPDISYLIENRQRVRGIVLTHGHEDHIGALPWILSSSTFPSGAPSSRSPTSKTNSTNMACSKTLTSARCGPTSASRLESSPSIPFASPTVWSTASRSPSI